MNKNSLIEYKLNKKSSGFFRFKKLEKDRIFGEAQSIEDNETKILIIDIPISEIIRVTPKYYKTKDKTIPNIFK